MSSLFNSLHTASTALNVFSRALGNEETNVANSSTAGYSAIRTTIRPIGPYGPPSGSPDYVDVQTSGDVQLDALYRASASQAGASQTLAGELTPVNQAFDITGSTGILAAFQKFSSAFADLSVNPNSSTLRASALSAASSVAAAFNKTAVDLDGQRTAADKNVAGTVAQINRLGTQIQRYNVQIRASNGADSGAASSLKAALDELSTLADNSVITKPDGTVDVLIGSQQPLVLGDQTFALSYTGANAAGHQIVSSGGGGGPASYSGKLGALLDFRNSTIGGLIGTPTVQGALNQLAEGFASRANALLTSGVTPTGAPGVPLFSWDQTNPANVAKSLVVDPTVTQSQLATATGTVSNGTADALAKLLTSTRPADLIGGFSAQDFYSGIAAGVGQQLSSAREQSTYDQTSVISAQSVRDKQTGVSLDQEAVAITAYQRAYQANAKVVSIISELTNDVVNLIR